MCQLKVHFCSLIGRSPRDRSAVIFQKTTERNVLIGPKIKIKANFSK